MENTKIPQCKSQLQRTAASAIPKTAAKPAGRIPLRAGVPAPGLLRRRSKSVADLRTLSKPDPLLSKIGAKRQLDSKLDDQRKAKVPKTKKIPDWDYKSRFLDLQIKYGKVQEDLKEHKTKLSDLQDVETRLKSLLTENTQFKATIAHHESQITTLIEKEKLLTQCKEQITIQLKESIIENAKLKDQKEILERQVIENSKKIDSLLGLNDQYSKDIARLRDQNLELNQTNEILKENVEYHENYRRVLHNTIQDLKGNIRVFCRVRPPVDEVERERLQCLISVPDEQSLEIKKSKESVSITGRPADVKQDFVFDKVFSMEADQEEVFEELAQLVQSALDGYNVCVFAYGQTGSGKTYTMQGTPENQGMIPRTVDLIFEKIIKLSTSNWQYDVTASFMEIYNERVKDLLVPNSTQNCEIRYNEGRGVVVTNLQTVSISDAQKLKELMTEAQENRAVAATDFNLHSSRSHAITKINLEGHNSMSKVSCSGSINLVDLAGSESAKTSSNERLHETKSINKSLSTLGSVMLALHNKDSHIPYRNSKLTFLLQSCLGGNSKTLMFVNISPFEECYGESLNSLRFAAKVKEVKTNARKNHKNLNV